MKEKKINKRGFSFETMSIQEMQVYMAERRKKQMEREAKRKKKAKQKAQEAIQASSQAGKAKLGGGSGARNNGYNAGAQEGANNIEEDDEDNWLNLIQFSNNFSERIKHDKVILVIFSESQVTWVRKEL